ncbi:MAG: hypothetical protein ACLTKI_07815 [Lachnospiraceae bacterium]
MRKNGQEQDNWKKQETLWMQESLPEEMEFNLSDFALFLSVMKRKEAHQCVLSIIMEDPGLTLDQVHVEEVVLNRAGKRAIRLDAWAVDTEKRRYTTEMQNDTASCRPRW